MVSRMIIGGSAGLRMIIARPRPAPPTISIALAVVLVNSSMLARVPGPADFLAVDLLRDTTANTVLRFKSRDDFYGLSATARSGYFTKTGNFLVLPDDTVDHDLELHYFGDVPHMQDADPNVSTWLSKRYNSILLHQTLALIHTASENDAKAAVERDLANSQITAANDQYKTSIGWGVKYSKKMKGFG